MSRPRFAPRAAARSPPGGDPNLDTFDVDTAARVVHIARTSLSPLRFSVLVQGLARTGFSIGASLAVSAQLQVNVAGLVISANGMGFIITPFFGLFIYEYVNPHLPFIFCAGLLSFMILYARFGLKDGVGEPDEEADAV